MTSTACGGPRNMRLAGRHCSRKCRRHAPEHRKKEVVHWWSAHLRQHPQLLPALPTRSRRQGDRLIDLGSRRLVAVREMLENTLEALDDDIRALGCERQVERVWRILEEGTSAHAQLQRYRERRDAGDSHAAALSHVVHWLADASAPA